MSDDVVKHFEPSPSDLPDRTGGKLVTLSVTLYPNSQVGFQLPSGNKLVAYGLLELARAQLDKLYLMEELQQQQLLPRGGVEGLLKRMTGGNHG